MANGWSGAALGPPGGIQFVPGVLAVGSNISDSETRLEVFTINKADGTVWHRWQVPVGGQIDWSEWGQLPRNPAGISFIPKPSEYIRPRTLAVVTNHPGTANQFLEVFAIGNDGNPYHTWQTPGGAEPWSAWALMQPVGQAVLSLDVSSGAGQLVAVYFSQGKAFFDFQLNPASGPWFGQTQHAVPQIPLPQAQPLGVGSLLQQVGPASLFALGEPGISYYANTLSNLSSAGWSAWSSGPTPTAQQGWLGRLSLVYPPAIASPFREWISLFVVDANGNFAGAQVLDPTQGAWSPFVSYGGPGYAQGILAVGSLPEFTTGGNRGGIEPPDQQYLMGFTVDRNSQRTVWNIPVLCDEVASSQRVIEPVQVGVSGGAVSALAVAANGDERLEVFAIEDSNQCSHWWQNAPGTAP